MADLTTTAHVATTAVTCCAAPAISVGFVHVLELLAPGATGAAIALFGVWLANRNARDTLRTQLNEAAKEATRAREFNVRREVYLDAAEAIATGHGAIGSLLDTSVSDADVRKTIASTAGKISKINVIGKVATLRAVKDYLCLLTEAQCKLWPARIKIQQFDTEIAALQAIIDNISKDQDRWIEMSKQHNVQAAAGQPAPPGAMELYQRQFEFCRNQREEFEARKATLLRLKGELGMRYFEIFIAQLHGLQAALPAALAAARTEMEMSIDLSEIEEIFLQVASRGEAAARQMVEDIGRLVGEANAAMTAAHPPSLRPRPPSPPAKSNA